MKIKTNQEEINLVVSMRNLENLKYRQIAKKLNRSLGWVTSVLKNNTESKPYKQEFIKEKVYPYFKKHNHVFLNPNYISRKQMSLKINDLYYKEVIDVWTKKETFFYASIILVQGGLISIQQAIGKMIVLQSLNTEDYSMVYHIIFPKGIIKNRILLNHLSEYISSKHNIEILFI